MGTVHNFERLQSESERYEQYVVEGRTAASHQWTLGDLAIKVSALKVYGDGTLERYANDIGIEYETLRRYRDVAKAWPETAIRIAFSVAMILATHPDRVAIVARKPHMTCEQAREIMRKARGKSASTKPPKPHPMAEEMIRLSDAGMSRSEIVEDLGISEHTLRRELEREAIRRSAGPQIDPSTLSMTAQQRLDAAERQMAKRLQAEHAFRMHALDEEVRQRVVKEGAKYRATLEKMENEHYRWEKHFREAVQNHKWPLTPEQYRDIYRCLHPDSRLSVSQQRLGVAFGLFKDRCLQLTGKDWKELKL